MTIFSKIKIFLFCSLSLCFLSLAVRGENNFNSAAFSFAISEKVKLTPQDSTTLYYTRGTDGLIIIPPATWTPFSDNVSFRDTAIYDPAFLPVVFDGKILPKNLDFLHKKKRTSVNQFHLLSPDKTFLPLLKKAEQIENLRRNFYMDMNNFDDVHYSAYTLKSIPKFDEEEVTKRNPSHELISVEDPIHINPIELPKADIEYIYWQKHGEHFLQIAQNYISDNWYKGGNSSFFIKNYHKFTLDYNKDKISFNNVLEWKLNLQRVNKAERHGTNISEDLLRMENTFGYKAFNHWSYSTRLETKTQLFNSYPVNGTEKNTAFLSPLVVNLGIGMSYKLEKKFESDKSKKLKFSQSISPLSINFTYLKDTTVVKRSEVEIGKRSNFEFGSVINTDLTFNFNRYMTWTSRLKYFTNYERAEMEFENKFDMALNRFLSTSIYLYWRFDDGKDAKREKNLGYFQLNELISFGLNYKW